MNCQNSKPQEFIVQINKSTPRCKEINMSYFFSYLPLSDNPDETSLILQLFEFRKIFLERRMVKFYAQGICMYPCMRPGDALHIEPRNAEQIEIGDIVVYRRSNRLFSHRAIGKPPHQSFGVGGKKRDNNLNYIITQPDTARYGNDGPIFDEDILGVVSYIERRGKILNTAKKDYSLVKRLILNFHFKCHHFRQYLFSKIVYVVTFVQHFNVYRKITKFLFSKSNKKVNFSIHTPLSSKVTSRFCRIISPQELIKLNIERNKNSISKWTIRLSVDSKPAAFLSFMFKPQNRPFSGWWLSEARIRLRYRGTGIEEKLFQQVDELLRQSGIPQIYVGIFKDAYLDRMVFRNMGFKEISTYEENLPRERDNSSIVRVIMGRKVKGG